MQYFLDTADLNDIKFCNEFYPLEGVTTNPSIISKTNSDFWEVVTSIRGIIGPNKLLHIQTVQKKVEQICEEARAIKERLGENTFIKIPISEEGLKATMILSKEKINVTMTAIFTPQQALLSAKAGASFVAPYVNRLDNISGDGSKVVADIVNQFNTYDLKCMVLAASFKNSEQVNRCAQAGCHSATVTRTILENLISHPMTDDAVTKFDFDWNKKYGEKTFLSK